MNYLSRLKIIYFLNFINIIRFKSKFDYKINNLILDLDSNIDSLINIIMRQRIMK